MSQDPLVRGVLQALCRVALTLLSIAGVSAAQDEPPRVRIVWTDTPPVIDGVMDEAVWETGAQLGPLTVVEPVQGATPSQRTEVRLLTDKDHFYLGVRAFDDEPEKIVAKRMIRGESQLSDDNFAIVLDTFHDLRNAYSFQITAAGGRSDDLNQGVESEGAWDAIWFAKTSIHEDGWVAEVAIPYKSINFNPKGDTWGFNFSRRIARTSENTRWADPYPQRFLSEMGRTGVLEGMLGIDQGIGLDVVVTGTTRRLVDEDRNRSRTTADPSVDVFYKVTPGLTATLTANTDFSDTEIDARQIVPTRFGRFFSEQRDFFLQDALIFDFGGLGGNARPFFSRRIGLGEEGDPIDIRFGGKLSGREGPYTIGLLGVQQERNAGIEVKNLLVGRIERNILKESKIGLIATHGDPSSNRNNSLVGLDFKYRNSKFRGTENSLTGGAWLQHSFSGNTDGSQAAFGGRIEYPNDRVNWKLEAQEIQRNFNPGLGFVNRPNIRRFDGQYRYRIRPEGSILQNIDFLATGSLVTNTGKRVESGKISLWPIGLNTVNNDFLQVRWDHFFERLVNPFEISNNVTLKPGSYHWDQGVIRFTANPNRALSGRIAFGGGSYWSGHRARGLVDMKWRPSKYLFLQFVYDHSEVWLPEGDFRLQLATLRLNLQFTPDISWVTFGQYDNVSDSYGYNSRFRWIIQDGREFFIIFNQDLDAREGLRVSRAEAVLKLQWTFRF